MEWPREQLFVAPEYTPLLRQLGLDARAVFADPRIRAWRTLSERDNATLDATIDGRSVRLHIKRFARTTALPSPAEREAAALRRVIEAGIATLPLVAWGRAIDGRSFLISEELYDHLPADKLLSASRCLFDDILAPTAALAATLHAAGLHHRDLYLCHFMARIDAPAQLRLIDVGRVARFADHTLGRLPLAAAFIERRWTIKDLAQFWYSTLDSAITPPITDAQRARWLEAYIAARTASPRPLGMTIGALRRAIERKAAAIARHDRRLRAARPTRNISIPDSPPDPTPPDTTPPNTSAPHPGPPHPGPPTPASAP